MRIGIVFMMIMLLGSVSAVHAQTPRGYGGLGWSPGGQGALTFEDIFSQERAEDDAGSETVTPFLAVDVNGYGGEFRGLTWHPESNVPAFSMNGSPRQAYGLTLRPMADSGQDAMLKSWRQHWDTAMTIEQVPWGTYDVYLYIIQSSSGEASDFIIDTGGQQYPMRMPSTPGRWFVAGPFRTAPNEQYVMTVIIKGFVNVAGVEVWHVER